MPYDRNRLPYPYSYRTILEQDSPDDFVVGDPQSSDPCNFFVVSLNDDEKRKFTSALLAGLDLLYPDEFVYLFQLWLQPTEFPNSFPPSTIGACNPVDLCQLILQCIQDTPSLQQAIAQYGGGGYSVPLDSPFDTEILGTNLISDNSSCDNDKLFGAMTGLVDLINDLATDFIQILQDNVNTAARVAELIEVIPGIGEVVPADIVTLAENFCEDLQNAYDAAYTVALRDEMRCDLYCLAQDECQVDFAEILAYYEGKLGFINVSDFDDFFGQYITGAFIGNQLVYAWYYFVIGMFSFGSEVLNIDQDKFVKMISALFNDPDSDWSVICDSCTPCQLPIDIDFEDQTAGDCGTIDEGTIQATPAIGGYALVYTLSNATVDPTINISIDDDGVRNITATWWQYWDSTLSSPRTITQQIRAYDVDNNQVGISASSVSRAKGVWIEVTETIVGASADIKRLEVKSAFNAGATPVTIAIDDIVIQE